MKLPEEDIVFISKSDRLLRLPNAPPNNKLLLIQVSSPLTSSVSDFALHAARSKLFANPAKNHRAPANGGSHLFGNPWAQPDGFLDGLSPPKDAPINRRQRACSRGMSEREQAR
jgi:hypothetical protein